MFFVLNEFVEVAMRALSPGVNDPFTAMQCIDWLSEGLVQLSRRTMPSPFRLDDRGDLRIVTTAVTYNDFVDLMVSQLIPYVCQDQNAQAYFIDSLRRVIAISQNKELNHLISEQIESLQSGNHGQ